MVVRRMCMTKLGFKGLIFSLVVNYILLGLGPRL